MTDTIQAEEGALVDIRVCETTHIGEPPPHAEVHLGKAQFRFSMDGPTQDGRQAWIYLSPNALRELAARALAVADEIEAAE